MTTSIPPALGLQLAVFGSILEKYESVLVSLRCPEYMKPERQTLIQAFCTECEEN